MYFGNKALIFCALSLSVSANISNWTGNGTSSSWLGAYNWDVVPGPDSDVEFGTATEETVSIPNGQIVSAKSLSFSTAGYLLNTSGGVEQAQLNLYPFGTAIAFNSSATISLDSGIINFMNDGTITVASSQTAFLGVADGLNNYPVWIYGDVNLAIQGTGEVLVDGQSTIGFAANSVLASGLSITINSYSALASEAGTFTLQAGTLTLNNGYVGSETTAVVILGGTLNNTNISQFANETDNLIISGGQITNDSSSYVALDALNVTINGGYVLNEGSFANYEAFNYPTLSLLSGSVTNDGGSMGYLAAMITISGGSLTSLNGGEIGNNCDGSISFSGGSIYNIDSSIGYKVAGVLTISDNAWLLNSGSAFVGDEAIGPGFITGGSVTNDSGRIYDWAGASLTISGGTITHLNGASMAYSLQSSLNIAGGYMSLDETSSLGPCLINMTQGVLINNGSISTLSTPSLFSGGSISGSGNMNLMGSNTFNMTITQASVMVGYAPVDLLEPATLYLNSPLYADLVISSEGSLYGQSKITGNVEAQEGGLIVPGGAAEGGSPLTIEGNLTLGRSSAITINFSEEGHNSIVIEGGELVIGSGAILDLQTISPFTFAQGTYSLIQFVDSRQMLSGTITGKFNVLGSQPLINYNLIYAPTQIVLETSVIPFAAVAKTANQRVVAQTFDALNGHTNTCLQNKIDQSVFLSQPMLDLLFTELGPSEFKAHQIVLEEMSFVINDNFSQKLYTKNLGAKFSLDGAYERINQNSYGQYCGFYANNGYQLLTFSYGQPAFQIGAAVGALETATYYKKLPSRSSSTSVISNLGVAGFSGRWSAGLEGLFGYHFIHTSRQIQNFDLKALSNHGAYGIKAQGHLSYKQPYKGVIFTPYDDLAYLYTYENGFSEHNATCLNLNVQSSARQMIRNVVGIALEGCQSGEVKPFLDVGYVYEYRFRGSHYIAQFVNTDILMRFQGIEPTKNFIKIACGLNGSKNSWDYQIRFNGQYGKRFNETGFNFSFGRRF